MFSELIIAEASTWELLIWTTPTLKYLIWCQVGFSAPFECRTEKTETERQLDRDRQRQANRKATRQTHRQMETADIHWKRQTDKNRENSGVTTAKTSSL